MKFATYLFLLAGASAIRVTQRSALREGPETVAQVLAHCDGNQDGKLSKKEIVACIKKDEPERTLADIEQDVSNRIPMLNKDGDEFLNKAEIQAALDAHNALAQHPTPAQIFEMCDTNKNGGITSAEAHACVDAHAPADQKEMLHKQIDEGFQHGDFDGDGEIQVNELETTMNQTHNETLAQHEGPSAEQIIAMCDTNKSKTLSKAEFHACVDKFAPADEKAELHHEIEENFNKTDLNGDGEINKEELEAGMMNALAQKEGNITAEEIIAHCEKNGKAGLQKSEIVACMHRMEPKRDIKEIQADVEKHFSHADKNGDGALDKAEIQADIEEEDSDSEEEEQ